MRQDQAIAKFRDHMRLRHLALSTEQSYLAWLGRYMRFLASVAEDLPTSEEKGEISRSAEGVVCWVRGAAEFSEEWPCVLTKAFPTAREAISDAMSQVAERVRERRRRRAWRRQIYGAEADGK